VIWALLLGLLVAHAEPADGLDDLTRGFWERGQRLEQQGDPRGAALAYRMTFQRAPSWTKAVLAEARVLAEAGDVEGALRAYDRAPFVPDVMEARGRLLLEEGQPAEAAEVFRRLRRLPLGHWPAVDLLLADALSRVDAQAAMEPLQRYFEHRSASLDADGAVPTVLRVVEEMRQLGRDDEALAMVADLLERFPDAEGVGALEFEAVRYEVGREAQRLARAAALPLSPAGVTEVQRAREQAFDGDVTSAESLLQEVVDREPRAAVAWSALARVRERAGDIDAAVQAARRAELLDPLEAEYSAQVGELLGQYFGGRMDREAAAAFTRAVQRRGSDPQLWHRKGTAERRLGWEAAARRSYQRVLDLDPDGPLAPVARRHLEGLDRALPPPPEEVAADAARPSHVPQAAWDGLHRAWAWQRRVDEGDDPADRERALDFALDEVRAARALAPDWVRAVNLEAAIRLDQGHVDEALELYRDSLVRDPQQGSVHRIVAELLRVRDPAASDAALDRAAELGEPSALLSRARRRAEAWQLWAARSDLARFRGLTVRGARAAAELDQQLARRQAGVAAGAGATTLFVLFVPLVWRWRSRAGVGLDELMARSGRVYPEVARVLAAVRHEVLKHHTTVLDQVADALEEGDEELVEWAAGRLFGPDGAVVRFDEHVHELVRIGERAGVRLNLLHRDPTFGPLMRSMAELASLEGSLHRGGHEQVARLRRLSIELNLDGYLALGRVLERLCLVNVDEGLIRRAFDAAVGEAASGAWREVSLTVEPFDQELWVRMYRADLHDVLVNLLRNAVEASVEDGEPRVGLRLAVDEDWITGLERVELRVLDTSPRRLSTAQVRGRFVGRGLGLAVDLVTRAGGSVHVEDESEWSKAVVVRLPRVERRREVMG